MKSSSKARVLLAVLRRCDVALPDGHPEPPCFWVTTSAGGTAVAQGGGRGVRAATGSRLCSPAGGA